MNEYLVPMILGIFIIVMGVANMKGNLSTIHWYHRKRVTEENQKPFGRLVGLGTVIIGAALVVYCLLCFISKQAQISLIETLANVLLIVALAFGLGLSFYAMIKYNKGIF